MSKEVIKIIAERREEIHFLLICLSGIEVLYHLSLIVSTLVRKVNLF
jgi:hypothetical protein